MRIRTSGLLSLALFAILLLTGLPQAQAQVAINFNHYKCYDIVESSPFDPRDVTLRDQFGNTVARVIRPRYLCNPVSKNDEGVPDPDVHLVCYEIVDNPAMHPRTVQIWDQFGTLKLVAQNPNLLCVPARKQLLQ